MSETTNLSRHWRELKVPITRLHDCEWPLPDVVDMHAVFPRPDADPQDPASYQFQLTDAYLQAIVDSGAEIVYRFGESIEHSAHKQYVHPPADCDRWSAACLGIIRHYNEGWADGFHHNIRYWEIWNEPENRPSMWSGSDDDYYRLYGTAAKAIKSQFPDLQVGGPAVGATGEVVDDRLQADAISSTGCWTTADSTTSRWTSSPGTPTPTIPTCTYARPTRFANGWTTTVSPTPRST